MARLTVEILMTSLLQPSLTTDGRHDEVVKELQQMRDRLIVLHRKSVTTLTKEHIDELLLIKNRIIVLQVLFREDWHTSIEA